MEETNIKNCGSCGKPLTFLIRSIIKNIDGTRTEYKFFPKCVECSKKKKYSSLSDREKLVLKLKTEGKTIKEISEIFKVSSGRVYSVFKKAKKKTTPEYIEKQKEAELKNIEKENKKKELLKKKQDTLLSRQKKERERRYKLLLELQNNGIAYNDYKGEFEILQKEFSK